MSMIVAGIHTGIGKTICSAILCQALGYDYWKPVQAGNLNDSDSMCVGRWVTHANCRVHPEAYRLQIAASPHDAAQAEGVEIKREKLKLPNTSNELVIETAGGLMSPFSDQLFNIDLPSHFQLPVVLVSNNYLGSINHTLLSVEALQSRNIEIKGLIFSGEEVQSTRSFLLSKTGLPLLFSVPYFSEINSEAIMSFAKSISIHGIPG